MENERDPQGRNIDSKYFSWANEMIKNDLKTKKIPLKVMFDHADQDFNISSVARNCSFFGVDKFYYYGVRRFDKRGLCGAHNYFDIEYIKIEDVLKLKEENKIIVFDNNVDGVVNIKDFEWPVNSILVIGNECSGVSPEVKEIADFKVQIPGTGVPRSINAACASSIGIFDYCSKLGYF